MGLPVYYLRCDQSLLHKQIAISHTQVGYTESHHNRGIADKYCRSTGIPLGSPYCASGIYWSFDSARSALALERSSIPLPRTGLANGMYGYAVRNGKKKIGTYQASDLIVWRKQPTIFGHIGQIVKKLQRGWIQTIEYNTGSQSQRDGDGVYMKYRNVLHPLGRMKTRGFITFKQ